MLTIDFIFLLGFAILLAPGLAVSAAIAPDNTAASFVAGELAKNRKPNRLLKEKSPYLLQHAFNPVDWYPWSEEALERARREGKPIFLSIGYSTCHWCHVMAHESFENAAIAALLNDHFICIKVDREERPDLDQIYMAATQALTGGGGWPMSVFLTPDRKPFYAGTYFPPESRHGLPGFGDLLQSIHRAWITDRDNILKAADNITAHLKQTGQSSSGSVEENILAKGYEQVAEMFDEKDGGFGKAPKFPRPVLFNFLLRYYDSHRAKRALDMTTATLRRMAAGGMYDHIGGGFHRYSVDGQWRVPHFEKMLYDQSQLAIAYLEAFQITRDPLYRRIAGEILDYVLRDMTTPEGGFFSAEDADSPVPDNPGKHSEGAFYLWSEKEIIAILGAEQAAIFNYRYGVRTDGNAPDDPHGEFAGRNILYIAHDLDSTARHFQKTLEEVDTTLRECRRKLFDVRQKRPRSHLDDKIITSWNGLMLSALAKGYQVLEDRRYLTGAEGAATFILSSLYDAKTKTLHRRYRDGQAGLPGQLDDYAFLIQGLLDLYETSFDIRWMQQAIELTKTQIMLFEDADRGFFDSPSDDGSLLLRMKSDYDGAEPAGNSVAALNLLRLAQFTGNQEWRLKAEKTMEAFGGRLAEYPPIMPQMLVALEFSLRKPLQIVLAGTPGNEDYRQLLQEVNGRFLPNMILLAADHGKGQEYLAQLLPFLKGLAPINGKATAYICENYTCKMPASERGALAKILNDRQL